LKLREAAGEMNRARSWIRRGRRIDRYENHNQVLNGFKHTHHAIASLTVIARGWALAGLKHFRFLLVEVSGGRDGSIHP